MNVRQALSRLRPFPAIRPVFFLVTVFFLYNILRAVLHPFNRRYGLRWDGPGLLRILLTYFSIFSLYYLLNGLVRHRRLRFVLNTVLLFVYFILFSYQMRTYADFDYFLLRDNFSEIFYRESLGIIWNVMKTPLLLLPLILLLVAFLEKKYHFFSGGEDRPRCPWRISLAAVIYGMFLFVLPPTYDPLTYFQQTAWQYHFGHLPVDVAGLPPFPFVRQPETATVAPPAAAERPHVFVVLIESFNARFAGTRTPDGREYTPFFNALRSRGVYYEKFYGNSVQTAAGQLVVLASIMPALRGKVSVAYPNLHLHGLPAVLAENGYRTLFFNAAGSNDFDSTGVFMNKLGFSHIAAMDGSFVTPADAPYFWGWGLQDDVFYRKFFSYLDKDQGRGAAAPYFAVLSTIASHMKWTEVPPAERRLYPQPRTVEQRYANALHLADRCLAEFFRQLESRAWLSNSVVFLLGDHSFPMGEHYNYYNEIGAYEESFRTPMLVIWPGRLPAGKVETVPASQLDIAPTVLDMAGIRTTTHFLGTSLIGPSAAVPRDIPLLQPYDGRYLCTIRFPWKYVLHLRTNREFLYNLTSDPQEDTNLLHSYRGTPLLASLRDSSKLFFLNQYLIEQNRIWPAGGVVPSH